MSYSDLKKKFSASLNTSFFSRNQNITLHHSLWAAVWFLNQRSSSFDTRENFSLCNGYWSSILQHWDFALMELFVWPRLSQTGRPQLCVLHMCVWPKLCMHLGGLVKWSLEQLSWKGTNPYTICTQFKLGFYHFSLIKSKLLMVSDSQI